MGTLAVLGATLWFLVMLPWLVLREALVALPRYFLWDCAAPRVACPVTPRNKEILDSMPCLGKPYRPTPWLLNGTIQTLFAMLRSPPDVGVLREVLDLPTSVGTTALDWAGESDKQYTSRSSVPIVLICPGTSGRSDEPLVRTVARSMTRHGWRVAVSNRPGATPGVPGDIPDIHGVYEFGEVVEYVHGVYPLAPLFGLGVSIGANVLTRYLARAGVHSRLVGVMAVSPILDVREHSRRLSLSPLWDCWTSWQLRGVFYEGQPHILQNQSLDHHTIRRSSSMQDLDNAFSRRVAGCHRNLDDFYSKLSTQHLLRDVAVPMLVLHAKDDPVVPLASLPYHELSNNCNIITVFTRRGGHAAFCQNTYGQGSYVATVAHQFLDAVLRIKSESLASDGSCGSPTSDRSDARLRTSNSFRGTPTQSFEQWNAMSAANRRSRDDRVARQVRKHSTLKEPDI